MCENCVALLQTPGDVTRKMVNTIITPRATSVKILNICKKCNHSWFTNEEELNPNYGKERLSS